MDNNFRKLLQLKEIVNSAKPRVVSGEVLPKISSGQLPPPPPSAAIPASAAAAAPWYTKLAPYLSKAAGAIAAMYPTDTGVGPGELGDMPTSVAVNPPAIIAENMQDTPALNIPLAPKVMPKIAVRQAPVEPSQASSQPTSTPQTSLDDIEMKHALQQRRESERDALVGQAMSELSAAAAGAGIGVEIAPSQINKLLLQAAGRPVEDIVLQRQQQKELIDLSTEKAKADPNSDISRYYRTIVAKLGQKVPENMSAAQMDKAFPMISAQINRQVSSEQNALRREELAQNREFQNSMKVQSAIDKKVDTMLKSDDHKMYSQANTAEVLLQNALSGGDADKVEAAAAFMNFAKLAQGDNSVVRAEDMKTLAGGYNYSNPTEMLAKLQAKARGGNFTKLELQQMLNVSRVIKQTKQQELQKRLSPIEKMAEVHKYDLSQSIDPTMMQNLKAAPIQLDKNIENYAKQYKLSYDQAEKILKSRGYGQQK